MVCWVTAAEVRLIAMAIPRVTEEILQDLERFARKTAEVWQQAGLIKKNSFGVQLNLADAYGGFRSVASFHHSDPEAEHDGRWYVENANGKNIVCELTRLDSHEGVRLYQGVLAGVDGVFPWGGAIIDLAYGLIIGTSGFKEDEDILFSRTLRNYLVMLLDRAGQASLDEARQRGEQKGEPGADRFTRAAVA